MDEWQTVRIEDVAEKVGMGPFGSSIKVSTFVPNGIPVISGQHLHGSRLNDNEFNFITEEHARKLGNANVQRGDVIFTHAGNIGQVAYIPETSRYDRYVISQRQFYMRCDRSKVIPEFVTYFFKTKEGRHKLLANTSQSGVPSIARPVTYLRTIEMSVPPLSTQRAIAHILGTLDDLIDLNRRTNETLEQIARILFNHYFPYSPDDDLPAGWRVGTIGDFADNLRFGISSDEIAPDASYIGLEHMPRRSIALSEWDTSAGLASGKFTFKKGDILFGKLRPYFHKVGIAPLEGVCSTDILVINARKPEWHSFVLGHVSSDALVRHADGSSTGTKMPRSNWHDMARYAIAVPPKTVATEYNRQVQPMLETIIANIHRSRTLAALRDLLLPKLLSGEIQVPEVSS